MTVRDLRDALGRLPPEADDWDLCGGDDVEIWPVTDITWSPKDRNLIISCEIGADRIP